MPWCPKCRTEYQEGIEKCADCGSDLVDELPEEEIPEENDTDIEIESIEEGIDEEGLINPEDLSEEELEEFKSQIKRSREPAKVYVSKADESRDMVQTAVTFLVFAVILIVLFVLGALDVIPWFSSIPSVIVLGAMSLGCCLVGINAAMRARRAQEKVGDEEKIKESVQTWLDEHVVKENIEEMFASVEPEEVKYMKEIEYVKDELMKEIEGLDEALADTMVEAYFDEHIN
ncbi:MAG: hypothetical protein K6F93_06760 [Lachnospiraceae bacterium]|nr:hypothetical protein [Lachnospiraceae bacterium]